MKLKTLLTAGTAIIALSSATATQAGEYYIGVFGGLSTFEDEFAFSITGQNSRSLSNTKVTGGYSFSTNFNTTASFTVGLSDEYDTGWVLGAAIGYDFGGGWRGEVEGAYRSFDLDGTVNIGLAYYAYATGTYAALPTGLGTAYTGNLGPYTTTLSTVANGVTDGEATVWSLMANVWYDFDIGDGPLVPFVGGGIGAARLNVDYSAVAPVTVNTVPYYTTVAASVNYSADGGGYVFAYQFGAGVGYDVGFGTLSAQYRYFATTDVNLGNTEVAAQSHSFLIGFNVPLN